MVSDSQAHFVACTGLLAAYDSLVTASTSANRWVADLARCMVSSYSNIRVPRVLLGSATFQGLTFEFKTGSGALWETPSRLQNPAQWLIPTVWHWLAGWLPVLSQLESENWAWSREEVAVSGSSACWSVCGHPSQWNPAFLEVIIYLDLSLHSYELASTDQVWAYDFAFHAHCWYRSRGNKMCDSSLVNHVLCPRILKHNKRETKSQSAWINPVIESHLKRRSINILVTQVP